MIYKLATYRWLPYVFLFSIVVFTFFPSLIRNLSILLTVFSIACVLFAQRVRYGLPNKSALIALLLFCLLCYVYALFSLMFGNWTEGYIFDVDYVFRHFYFSIMLPIFIFSSMFIFRVINTEISNFLENYGLSLIIFFLSIDICLAYFFGDELFRLYNGYTYFIDKGFIWLFISYIFFYCLSKNVKPNAVFICVILGFSLQNYLGYGTMFTAATGKLMFIIMCLSFTLLRFTKYKNFFTPFLIIIAVSVILFVFITPFFSELFYDDLNTYWRLESWKNNLLAVWSNLGFGSGFGTSYFPLTTDVIDAAYKSYSLVDSNRGLLEQVFIRGQHSSLINITFRVGILGFLLFLSFLFLTLKHHIQSNNREEYIYLVPVFLCAIFNIATHVGLESPPYMLSFAIISGFLIESTIIKD